MIKARKKNGDDSDAHTITIALKISTSHLTIIDIINLATQ